MSTNEMKCDLYYKIKMETYCAKPYIIIQYVLKKSATDIKPI